MKQQLRGLWRTFGHYILWAILAALLALALYQLHATLLFLGLKAVENPSTRPAGWNTDTIHGLGRFLFLVLGAAWLVSMSLMESFLGQAQEEGRLWTAAGRLLLAVGAIYALSYLLVLPFS
jgi:hypothetical protein